MAKVLLQRDTGASNKVTFGKLYLTWIKDKHPDIYTIELPDKNNKPDASCIPAGIYTCIPHVTKNSLGVERKTWQLQGVPNRSGVNFDIANYACDCVDGGVQKHAEIKGCIAVGFGIDEGVPKITKSHDAMVYLLNQIGVNTTFEIEIKD